MEKILYERSEKGSTLKIKIDFKLISKSKKMQREKCHKEKVYEIHYKKLI